MLHSTASRHPKGRRDRCLGGAATYFALAASYFTDVRVIAVVGEDFTAEHEAVLTRRGVDTQGLEHTAGKSFHWTGSYVKSLNEAQTLNTELNVFETFAPKVPAAYKDSEFLFLANIDPVLQSNVRQQMPKVRMVCGDTMNYWITGHRENLAKVLTGLDALLINDGEAKLLADDNNLVLAARKILAMGPKALIVKHGEYGATAFFGDQGFNGNRPDQSRVAFSRTRVAAGRGSRSHRVQAIPSPAASSATSPRNRRSPCRPSNTPCSTAVSWAPLRCSASVRNRCNRSRERRSISASLSSVSFLTLTEKRKN